MTKNSSSCFNSCLSFDFLNDTINTANTLSYNDDEMLFACFTILEKNINNIFLKVIRNFRNKDSTCTDSNTNLKSNISTSSAHNLNNTTSVMRLCSITNFINHFHSCIHSCIETDCIITTRNIVINSTRNTYTWNTFACKVSCTSEWTVTTNNNNTINAKFSAVISSLFYAFLSIKLWTSCCIKNSTTLA